MTVPLHDPPNTDPLDELYVFVSEDADGNRGVIGSVIDGLGATPFVTGSRAVAKRMQQIANALAAQTGKSIVLYKYTRGAELWRA